MPYVLKSRCACDESEQYSRLKERGRDVLNRRVFSLRFPEEFNSAFNENAIALKRRRPTYDQMPAMQHR